MKAAIPIALDLSINPCSAPKTHIVFSRKRSRAQRQMHPCCLISSDTEQGCDLLCELDLMSSLSMESGRKMGPCPKSLAIGCTLWGPALPCHRALPLGRQDVGSFTVLTACYCQVGVGPKGSPGTLLWSWESSLRLGAARAGSGFSSTTKRLGPWSSQVLGHLGSSGSH